VSWRCGSRTDKDIGDVGRLGPGVERSSAVGPGIFLLVLGAVLTFAVREDTPLLDVQVTGLIFMIAGGALVYLSSRTKRRERSVVTRDDLSHPERPLHEVHETVVDHDPWRPNDQPQGRTNL
jgi:hypothetical protein